jgi:hypothetical protein
MQSPTNQGVLNRVNLMLLIGLKQSGICMILQNVAGTSADVFLNCSLIISALFSPSQQNNSLRQQNSGNPIVIAILGTFAVPLKSDEASTRVI